MNITKAKTEQEVGSSVFSKSHSGYFDADTVIDAYFQGREDGTSDVQRSVIELVKRNLRDATKLIERIEKRLFDLNIEFSNLYLKIAGVYSIDVLAVVTEDDFLRDEFLPVYDLLSELEEEFNSESLTISFSFMPKGEHFNEEEILSDSYLSTQNISQLK